MLNNKYHRGWRGEREATEMRELCWQLAEEAERVGSSDSLLCVRCANQIQVKDSAEPPADVSRPEINCFS